jgi:hypothetical protein
VNITSTTTTGVSFSVAQNTVTSTRSTTITVSGTSGASATFTVTQDAAPSTQACTFTIDRNNADFGPRGGQGTVQVTTTRDCAWTASEAVDWITLGASGGTGPGSLSYTVSPNPNDDRREATITVAGHPHRVRQDGDDDDDIIVSYRVMVLYIT